MRGNTNFNTDECIFSDQIDDLSGEVNNVSKEPLIE